jgi:hypothetical protein
MIERPDRGAKLLYGLIDYKTIYYGNRTGAEGRTSGLFFIGF